MFSHTSKKLSVTNVIVCKTLYVVQFVEDTKHGNDWDTHNSICRISHSWHFSNFFTEIVNTILLSFLSILFTKQVGLSVRRIGVGN